MHSTARWARKAARPPSTTIVRRRSLMGTPRGELQRASVATLLRVRLTHEGFEALWVAQLAIGDRVELAVQLVAHAELAARTVLRDPEQRRGAERAHLRIAARARAATGQVSAHRVLGGG